MIEIFRNTNYDFLGKKWLCIGLSCMLLLLGVASIVWRAVDGNPNTHPFNLGVNFTGGTIVNVKFKQKPDPDVIRAAIEKQGVDGSKITIQPVGEEIGQAPKNEVLIRLPNLPATESQSRQPETPKSAEGQGGQPEATKSAEGQGGQSRAAKTDAEGDLGQKKIRDALKTFNDPAVTQNKEDRDLNMIGRDKLREELQS